MADKLPPNAKMVFKGEIFEVWHYDQKLYDGSIKTFELLKRTATSQIVATVGGKVVLQKQEQPQSEKPYFSLPAGRLNAGEAPLAAAKRELLEETGLASEDWALWQSYRPSGKIIWTVYLFIARNCQKAAEPKLDPGEKIENRLVTFEEFLGFSNNPNLLDCRLQNVLWRARADGKFKSELRRLLFPGGGAKP